MGNGDLRVLLSVPSLDPRFGGPAAKAQDLVSALRQLGHEAEVVGCGVAKEAIGLPVIGRFHGTPIPRTLRPLLRAVGRAQVVHILGLRDPVGSVSAYAAHRAGVPYLLEPTGMHRRRLRSLRLKAAFDATVGRRILASAALVVATSELESRQLTEDGVPPERIRVRPNGVSVNGLWPPPLRGAFRGRLGIPQGAPVVLAMGRIAAGKGLVDVARAVSRLDGVHAVVAGPDDGDGTLGDLVRVQTRLGLERRLHLLPAGVWGRDKAEAFANADCFCLPSATESFGSAAAEAAAIGLPVVVSDMCGVAEQLDPSGSRVVPYGDLDAIAEAIRECLTDNQTREKAALAASELRKTLDWNRIAQLQVATYEEAIESNVS
jgi:glycosyltransferase involved in cell wall biosynthesis